MQVLSRVARGFSQAIPRLLIAGLLSILPFVTGTAQVDDKAVYRPKLAVSETMDAYLKQLEPGKDAFPLERQSEELDARLRELADALRGGAARTSALMSRLLDPGFLGARLIPVEAGAATDAPLDVQRAKD